MKFISLSMALLMGSTAVVYAATSGNPDVATKFSNRGSISETRHNLSQLQSDFSNGNIDENQMNSSRNQYNEVCVYCHTPHGANDAAIVASAPLWNRTVNDTGYTTYASNNSTTITTAIAQPGANSLTCLSCHDGTIAIDSIINMPGSGAYDPNQKLLSTQTDFSFLDTWANPIPAGHTTLGNSNESGAQEECMACHAAGGTAGVIAPGATTFRVFVIGTNLTNDHPIGINFPSSRVGVDFNGTNGATSNGGAIFYDESDVGFMNDSDVRFYNNGGGDFTVECASCHDPHGVESAGAGSQHLPTFLRKTNSASALCQTCHNK